MGCDGVCVLGGLQNMLESCIDKRKVQPFERMIEKFV